MKSSCVVSRVCLFALLLFACAGVMAQVQNGVFTGTVTDPQGAALAGAAVTITNQDTGYSSAVKTNESGQYTSQSLPVGNYKFNVESSGFKTATKQNVKLDVGTTARLDFRMAVGQATETIEVTTEAAVVNTEDSKLASNVGASQIESLPLNGRNVYNLIQLAPGAINVREVVSENGADTVVNGLRENFNGFLINGVSNKGLSGGVYTQPIQDSVQEFQELTLNMSAQYGNSAGSVTNLVTKNGTNSFHGSGWGFFRNRNLDATPFFVNHGGQEKPPLDLKQFGATIGGPIIKDKLFFFGAWQSDRFITSNTPAPVTVESPEFRAGVISLMPGTVAAVLYNDFVPGNSSNTFGGGAPQSVDEYINDTYGGYGYLLCDSETDGVGSAAAARFAQLLGVTAADQAAVGAIGGCSVPALNGNPAALGFRNVPFEVDATSIFKSQTEDNLFDGNEFSVRVDYNVTNNDRIFGQFNWIKKKDAFFTGPTQTPFRGFTNPAKASNPNAQFNYTHVFSPSTVNEFRAGYAGCIGCLDIGTSHPGVPAVGFDDGSVGFGSYNGYPQFFHEHIFTYSDLVSINKGKHGVKVGAEIRRNIENSEFNVSRPSYYFFDPLFFAADAPYLEVAGVDPGFVAGRPAELASNFRHWRNVEYGFYFQDDWKIHPRLTLNLGLRYDLYQRHKELNNLETTFILGPGSTIVDQIVNANIPAGQPGCDTPTQIAQATLAGVCGPGGFAAAESLGKGDHNNFGPRFGFAWDVFGDGKTSLRGGFGVAYEGTLYNPLSNSRWNPPYYSFNLAYNFLVGDVSNIIYGPQSGGTPRYEGDADPLNFQGTGAQATGNISGWDPNNPNIAYLTGIVLPEGIKDPYVYNYFLSIQREIMPKLVFEATYVGTQGHKLFRAEDINRAPGGVLDPGLCVTDNLGRTNCGFGGRPNPNYGRMRNWQNVVNSNYNALQLQLKKAMSHGVSLNANYTWSHTIDGGSTWHSGATSANNEAAGEGFTTDQTAPQVDRGNSIFDVRHRFALNYVWELPAFKDANAFVRHVFGNWSWNGIVTYQSGAHWSPFRRTFSDLVGDCTQGGIDAGLCINDGGDYNLDGIRNDRPNSTVTNFDPSTAQWADGWGNVDTLFSSPCLGCVATLGRNTFVGPNFIGADMSLFKNIAITERWKAQFRWEVFNVFNRTNFQLPGAQAQVNNRINVDTFGRSGGTFIPRQMQLGLKISF